MWIVLAILGILPLMAGIGHWVSGDAASGIPGVGVGVAMILPQLLMLLVPWVISWFN